MTWSIYALRDPETAEIRYVGCTTNVAARFYKHIWWGGRFIASRYLSGEQYRWIADLIVRGLSPILHVLETGDGTFRDGFPAERRWVALLLRSGHRLLNNNLVNRKERHFA